MKRSASPSLRVLFVGSTAGDSTSVHYFTNFLKLGFSVYPFDPNLFHTQNLWERALVAVSKTPPQRNIERAEGALIELCRKNPFDLVFVMAQNFLSPSCLAQMREVSNVQTTLVYHSHDNNFSPGVLTPPDFEDVIRSFDFVFTTKSQNVERYKLWGQANSYFIPSAYEPTIHRPVPDSHSRYAKDRFPISFVGTYDKSRDPILEKLGGERLEVWGSHWARSPHYGKQFARIHPYPIYFFEYSDVISHSQCSLGLLRAEAQDLHTQRTFEIPACGTLQLAPRNDEILSFFEEDREIICFSSPEELKHKVDYYLSHPQSRQKIAQKGYERCLKSEHAYSDRISRILEVTGLVKKNKLKAA